jgi:hypothetical protein
MLRVPFAGEPSLEPWSFEAERDVNMIVAGQFSGGDLRFWPGHCLKLALVQPHSIMFQAA